jgi:hypothetical protein
MRGPSVRAKGTLLLTALAAGIVAVPVAHAGTSTSAAAPADPCALSITSPAGNAYPYGIVYTGAVPAGTPGSIDDLDILTGSVRLTATDLVATIHVQQLADDSHGAAAASQWGDQFSVTLGTDGGASPPYAVAGYFRQQDGGGPVFDGNAFKEQAGPREPTYRTSLHAAFDPAHNTVTLTLPRADLLRAFGNPKAPLVLKNIALNAQMRLATSALRGGDYAPATGAALSVAACDRTLKTAPASDTPCLSTIQGFAGDERSQVGDDARVYDDNLDVIGASVRLTKTTLVVTAQIGRVGYQPLDSTGGEYDLFFADPKGALHHIEAWVDPVNGNHLVDLAGSSGPVPTGTFDLVNNVVTFRVARADIAKAFKLAKASTLVVAGVGVSTYFIAGSQDAAGGADAVQSQGKLTATSCDRWLVKHPRG